MGVAESKEALTKCEGMKEVLCMVVERAEFTRVRYETTK